MERRHVTLGKGERQVVNFSGDAAAAKQGNFTVTVTRAAAGLPPNFPLYRERLDAANPGKAGQPEPPRRGMPLTAQYGPETNTVLVKADILDLPHRQDVAAAEAKVVETETGKVLGSVPMRPFSEWYGGAELHLKDVAIPIDDFRQRGSERPPATPARKCKWSSSSATRMARS